jgi:hypothetical protein
MCEYELDSSSSGQIPVAALIKMADSDTSGFFRNGTFID